MQDPCVLRHELQPLLRYWSVHWVYGVGTVFIMRVILPNWALSLFGRICLCWHYLILIALSLLNFIFCYLDICLAACCVVEVKHGLLWFLRPMACEVTSRNVTVSETTIHLFFTVELKTYLLLKYLQYSGYRSLCWTLLGSLIFCLGQFAHGIFSPPNNLHCR